MPVVFWVAVWVVLSVAVRVVIRTATPSERQKPCTARVSPLAFRRRQGGGFLYWGSVTGAVPAGAACTASAAQSLARDPGAPADLRVSAINAHMHDPEARLGNAEEVRR
jgi:hypothetical protein